MEEVDLYGTNFYTFCYEGSGHTGLGCSTTIWMKVFAIVLS